MNQSFNLDAGAAVEMEALMQSVLLQRNYHQNATSRFINKQPLTLNREDMSGS